MWNLLFYHFMFPIHDKQNSVTVKKNPNGRLKEIPDFILTAICNMKNLNNMFKILNFKIICCT